MSFGAPSAPPTPPPPPPLNQPQGLEAAQSQQRRAAMAKGPGSTQVTGPQGLTTPASTSRQNLASVLGG